MYAIVKFPDEFDAPGIVCSHWINSSEKSCLYPNVRTNEARDRLLRKCAQPTMNWISCRIKILHKYNSFSEALLHLSKAEETSNLESEDVTINRQKKIRKDITYSEEESDEDSSLIQKSKGSKKAYTYIDPYPIPTSQLQPETSYFVPPSVNKISDNNIDENPQSSSSAQSYLEKPPACSSSGTLMNGKFVAWMADISDKVHKLDDKVDLILKNQAKLLQQHNQVSETLDRNEDYEVLGSLPATDDSSFEEINQKVAEDSHLRHLLVKVLISVGGRDMRYHIHNMLRRLLSDDVAELYSLSGKSTLNNMIKKPFLVTEVSKSIFFACQKVFKETATEVQIKEAVGDWLNQAKVRKLRRMQRYEKSVENVE